MTIKIMANLETDPKQLNDFALHRYHDFLIPAADSRVTYNTT
jgi:hypothetical protein